MLRQGVLRSLLGVSLGLSGCLDAGGLAGEGGSEPTWPPQEPRAQSAGDGARDATAAAVEPEAADLAVCQAQAARLERCGRDPAGAPDALACARRFACSRRLWRDGIAAEVYACLGERPCDDADPAMSCLGEAARSLAPSEAARRFERAREEAERACGPLLEVAPAQIDLVYDAVTFCLTENESCDAKTECVATALTDIVAAVCGSRGASPIEPADEPEPAPPEPGSPDRASA